ncbi:MAG: branched-chain amino acid ABC transporter substrate-binding protein [Acidimicrobiales bacterium]
MTRRAVVAALLALAVVLPACSDGGDKVATVGVVAPLDSGLVQFGRGIRNSVQLAVDEANARKAIPGWRIEVAAMDDSSDPTVGAAAAQRLAADDGVIGVIGTYNSGVAAQVAPVLDAASIVMISPGNTNPSLTLGSDAANPSRPHGNYFRMVANDATQGPFLAQMALSVAQARRVAVVSETKAVSKGLADAFSAAFTRAGGSIVLTRVVPDGATDFSALVREIAPLRPDVLFFGGEYNVGATFSKQASEAGITASVMGGDGIKDEAYITAAGPAADGDLASTVGVPLSAPSERSFLDAYEKAGFTEPPSDFGPYAYDATNVVLAAAASALKSESEVTASARRAIITGVQNTDTTGVTGPISFDAYGDTRNKVLTLYRVSGAAWVPVKTETLS